MSDHPTQEKILLLLLPFWTPLMPPMGICSIKSYLAGQGFSVKTVDANTHVELWEIYHKYFDTLKQFIPQNRQGNYYNMGFNVLRNHLMAAFNHHQESDYREIVKLIIYNHYYCDLHDDRITQLNEILAIYFHRLEKFLLDLLEREKPTMVGISVFNGTLASSVFAFNFIKEKYPHIKTLFGGGVFTGQFTTDAPDLEYFLEKVTSIDKIMIGQGEILWLKYLRGELPENQRVYTINDVAGQSVPFAQLDIPDYSDLRIEYYKYMGATGSASCPYLCSFCNVNKYYGEHRIKDVRQTAAEMTRLYNLYHRQMFFMTDALLNTIATDLANEMIRLDTSLYWDGYLRVDDMVCDPRNTLLWRRGGFYRARLGVESGSQRVLNLMGKNITVNQIKRSISALAYAGIKTTVYIVIGHPGETEADFQQTLDLITELKDDIWQAEANAFIYYYTGQGGSDDWSEHRFTLYPEKFRETLITQTWELDLEPLRAEKFDRVFRFAEHCRKLGIPNAYSTQEIHRADQRWQKLHKNAVPALLEFENHSVVINERGKVGEILKAVNPVAINDDFDFPEFG